MLCVCGFKQSFHGLTNTFICLFRLLHSPYQHYNLDDDFRYDEDGNTHGKIEVIPPAPTRLQWDFRNQQLLKTIDEAYGDAQKVLNVIIDYQN